jgi:group I intron endonuclease
MAKEKICGIYCIENIVNSKKYIGQSTNIHARWRQHLSYLRRGKHCNEKLQNAWNKYGEMNFKFYIVVESDIDLLDKFEMQYISLYDSYKNGYNKDIGGFSHKNMSDETKRKISESRKNLSEQAVENMRNSHETKPIYQINLNGIIVQMWKGAREASRELNINQAAIWQCLHHERLTLHGFIWLFVDEYSTFNLLNYLNKNTQPKKIAQKNPDGELIEVWCSANSAQKFGFDSSCIIKCCKGKRKYYKGFLWSYYEDDSLTIQN